jgi:ABC-type transport system involved in cytochrome c biogenesis permease subunit
MVASTPMADRRPARFNPWLVAARILGLMTLAQAFFAGALLSGYTEGRLAHRLNAYSLFAITLIMVVAAIATQRATPEGRRLIAASAQFLAGIMVVAIIGMMSAEGHRLLWLHVPAGVMMMGGAAALQGAAAHLREPAGT